MLHILMTDDFHITSQHSAMKIEVSNSIIYLLQLILTMLYVSSKDIFFLIEMEGFGFASVLTMVFAGQVYLRYKEPNIPRPIQVRKFSKSLPL